MKKIVLNPEQLRVDTFHVDRERAGAGGTVQAHDEANAFFVTNAASGCNTCAATCETLICDC